MTWTLGDLIWWLRNGNNCGPFLYPGEIWDDGLTVEILGEEQLVLVYDEGLPGEVAVAPLTEMFEIKWEEWAGEEVDGRIGKRGR